METFDKWAQRVMCVAFVICGLGLALFMLATIGKASSRLVAWAWNKPKMERFLEPDLPEIKFINSPTGTNKSGTTTYFHWYKGVGYIVAEYDPAFRSSNTTPTTTDEEKLHVRQIVERQVQP